MKTDNIKAKIAGMLYAILSLPLDGETLDEHESRTGEDPNYYAPECLTDKLMYVKNRNIIVNFDPIGGWRTDIPFAPVYRKYTFKYKASDPVKDWIEYYSRQVVNYLTSHYSSVKIHNWELFLERINEGVGRYPDSMNALEQAINNSDIFVMLNKARQYLQIHGIELESNPWNLCKYESMYNGRDCLTGELCDEYDFNLIERFAENVDMIRCNAIDPNKIKILAYRPFGNLMTACQHNNNYVSWDIFRVGLILALVAGIESDCYSTVEWAYEEMIILR